MSENTKTTMFFMSTIIAVIIIIATSMAINRTIEQSAMTKRATIAAEAVKEITNTVMRCQCAW